METGLAGKRVLVTGGAGGIGSACVRAFAAEGARVAIHYRTSAEHAAELARETGGVALQADLTVEDEVDALFEAAERELGGVDVCAAVAGFWPREDEPVWELPLERWETTLRANLTATFLTARGFLRLVERTGQGNLVLVGSTAGQLRRGGTCRLCGREGRDPGGAAPEPQERDRPGSRRSAASTPSPRAGRTPR